MFCINQGTTYPQPRRDPRAGFDRSRVILKALSLQHCQRTAPRSVRVREARFDAFGAVPSQTSGATKNQAPQSGAVRCVEQITRQTVIIAARDRRAHLNPAIEVTGGAR